MSDNIPITKAATPISYMLSTVSMATAAMQHNCDQLQYETIFQTNRGMTTSLIKLLDDLGSMGGTPSYHLIFFYIFARI